MLCIYPLYVLLYIYIYVYIYIYGAARDIPAPNLSTKIIPTKIC